MNFSIQNDGNSGASSLAGPATVRNKGKIALSMSDLRDVNRCAVRPTDLIAHQGYTVLVTNIDGHINEEGIEGFFLHQTRFLSRFRVKIEGSDPKFVSGNAVDHHFITAYYLAPTPAGSAAGPKRDAEGDAAGEVVQKGIELQVNAFTGAGLHIDLVVTNHAMAEADVTVTLHLEADFADFNECLAGKRQQNAIVERAFAATPGGGTLDFTYLHPKLDLASRIVLDGADEVIDLGHALALRLKLAPHRPRLMSLDLSPLFEGVRHTPLYGRDGVFAADALPTTARRDWVSNCLDVELANPVVQMAWDQAVSDLASLQVLEGPSSEPFMITAGMPNYTGLFGRDAYLTALQTAGLNPMTLRGALEVVSRFNAETTDDEIDAEPGKVLHQRQLGPLAKLGLSPFLHYYGDASTPGLFMLAAAADLAHTGDTAFFLSLKPKLMGTLAWMKHNADDLGFYPYQTRSKHGVKNQSWKDSGEAVLTADGTDVADPIAMADIQALYYAGQQALGLAFLTVGEDALGAELISGAEALKERFNAAFWMPEERFFAIALGPDKQQVKTVASDPGACLAYGIVDPDKAPAIAERLLSDEMFSGWGIRTLSSQHPAYNPFSYHLGSVWPSPNAVTAFGLKRFGFDDEMFRVAEGLFAASQVFTLDRLPEVFGGHTRDARHPHPGLYPGACSPQAWSSGAVILLVTAMLGLMPLAPRRTLVVDPALPEWLTEITVRNIQVGAARAALRFRRDLSGHTNVEVLDDGGLLIVRPDLSSLVKGEDRVAASFKAAFNPESSTLLAGKT